jgi:hypothetical protein
MPLPYLYGIPCDDVTDGGSYTLERQSGDLTVVVVLSTGGYFPP